MCIKKDCKVHTHEKKYEFDFGMAGERFFVGTRSEDPDSVYTEHSVEAGLLGNNLMKYMNETRPVQSWITLFTSLKSGKELEGVKYEDSDVSRMIQTIDDEVTEGKIR